MQPECPVLIGKQRKATVAGLPTKRHARPTRGATRFPCNDRARLDPIRPGDHAKLLGVAIPPNLLAITDEVIK
jgi:hypothetical protein